MDEDNQVRRKKGRGSTKLTWIDQLPIEGKFKIELDNKLQPLGVNATHLSSYIGYLAKDGNMFPLTIYNWKDMEKLHRDLIDNAITQIKEIFETPPNFDEWLSERLSSRWRDFKCKIKREGFTPFDKIEDQYANRPDGVVPSQWVEMVNYWNKDKVKEQSLKNARNRACNQIPHTGGSKSFANHADELRKKHNKSPSRTMLYRKTYTRKNLAPVNPSAREKMDQMEKLERQMTQDIQPDEEFIDIGPNDIFSQVMGPDRAGRVRGYGPVKPKRCWVGETSNSGQKTKAEVVELRQEVVQLKNQLKQQNDLLKMLAEKFTHIENDCFVGENASKDSRGSSQAPTLLN